MKIHFRGNILIVDGEQQICPKGNAERFCRKNCALMQVTEQTSKSLNLEGVTEVIEGVTEGETVLLNPGVIQSKWSNAGKIVAK